MLRRLLHRCSHQRALLPQFLPRFSFTPLQFSHHRAASTSNDGSNAPGQFHFNRIRDAMPLSASEDLHFARRTFDGVCQEYFSSPKVKFLTEKGSSQVFYRPQIEQHIRDAALIAAKVERALRECDEQSSSGGGGMRMRKIGGNASAFLLDDYDRAKAALHTAPSHFTRMLAHELLKTSKATYAHPLLGFGKVDAFIDGLRGEAAQSVFNYGSWSGEQDQAYRQREATRQRAAEWRARASSALPFFRVFFAMMLVVAVLVWFSLSERQQRRLLNRLYATAALYLPRRALSSSDDDDDERFAAEMRAVELSQQREDDMSESAAKVKEAFAAVLPEPVSAVFFSPGASHDHSSSSHVSAEKRAPWGPVAKASHKMLQSSWTVREAAAEALDDAAFFGQK